MRYILYAILIYIAYQFIFNLVIPVYKTSRKIKKGFREMHGRMQEQMNTQNTNAGQKHEKSTTVQQDRSEDYIDFEEIK